MRVIIAYFLNFRDNINNGSIIEVFENEMRKRRETMMSPKNRSLLSILLVSVLGLVIVPGLSASSQTQDLPEDPYERGMVLLKQFKYGEAKTSFDQVLSQNPKHLNAYYFTRESSCRTRAA